MKILYITSYVVMNKKAYDNMLSSRPYQTEIKICNCERQDCKGRFLTRVNSGQTVCLYELRRINYMNTSRWIYKNSKTPIYKHCDYKPVKKAKSYKDYLKNEYNKPIQKKD